MRKFQGHGDAIISYLELHKGSAKLMQRKKCNAFVMVSKTFNNDDMRAFAGM